MRRVIFNELTTENILSIAEKCDYEICTEFNAKGTLLLQDAGCLSSFIVDAGITFLKNDDNFFYYSMNNDDSSNKIIFKVPYKEIIDMGEPDAYLDFDKREIVERMPSCILA